MTNTIMGPMSEYLAYSIPMSVGCVGFVQMLSLLGLSYRPSKKDIRGIEERIKYEKDMIDLADAINLALSKDKNNILKARELVKKIVGGI